MQKTSISVNTTSTIPTRFLRGVELVEWATRAFGQASENWPEPRMQFGDVSGRYYAEVWVNGMDWNHSYWLLEHANWDEPSIMPLMRFDKHEEEDKFNDYDRKQLMNAIMWYRRDKLWIKHNDLGPFGDSVWHYIRIAKELPIIGGIENSMKMVEAVYNHASQQPVRFEMPLDHIPEGRRQTLEGASVGPLAGMKRRDRIRGPGDPDDG